MEGRWTIWIEGDGAYIEPDSAYEKSNGDHRVPVVPCDDAAIGRAMDALEASDKDYQYVSRADIRTAAEAVLRAAGETP